MRWIDERPNVVANDRIRYTHLLGRVMIYGAHTFLDELLSKPVYEYKKLQPPCLMLSMMNLPNVQNGVALLHAAANDGIISAMLDLADVYCTDFNNDPFEKDKEKAEMWYVKALGKKNQIFPLAFTRYGDFLKWEQRFTEAKDAYEVATTYGHTRGQYEYSLCLLELSKTDDSSNSCANEEESKLNYTRINQNMEDALCYLCKASEKGFYIPSYTALAKLLIEIAERAYGTLFVVGRSPLPRILQILNLAMEEEDMTTTTTTTSSTTTSTSSRPRYGASQEWEDETSILLKSYEKTKMKCSHCGQEGSEVNPLRLCGTCGSVAYCSKICQKRDYRDGHKFDCCSRQDLFNFQAIRYTLPWVSTEGWKREGVDMPCLNSSRERSLIQMVEDDTDEIYGEEDQDYDEDILTHLMFRMRQNLETYLNQELNGNTASANDASGAAGSGGNLQKQIEKFSSKNAEDYPECEGFINAMNTIRTLGNNAVHKSRLEEKKIEQLECEQAVHEYRTQKEKYEKYRERAVVVEVCPPDVTKVGSLESTDKIQTTPDKTLGTNAATLQLKDMLGVDNHKESNDAKTPSSDHEQVKKKKKSNTTTTSSSNGDNSSKASASTSKKKKKQRRKKKNGKK